MAARAVAAVGPGNGPHGLGLKSALSPHFIPEASLTGRPSAELWIGKEGRANKERRMQGRRYECPMQRERAVAARGDGLDRPA